MLTLNLHIFPLIINKINLPNSIYQPPRSKAWPRGTVGWWPPGSLRSMPTWRRTPRSARKRSCGRRNRTWSIGAPRCATGGVWFFTRKIWEFQWWFFGLLLLWRLLLILILEYYYYYYYFIVMVIVVVIIIYSYVCMYVYTYIYIYIQYIYIYIYVWLYMYIYIFTYYVWCYIDAGVDSGSLPEFLGWTFKTYPSCGSIWLPGNGWKWAERVSQMFSFDPATGCFIYTSMEIIPRDLILRVFSLRIFCGTLSCNLRELT